MRHKKKRKRIVYFIGILILCTIIWFSSRNRELLGIEKTVKDFINSIQKVVQSPIKGEMKNIIDLPLSIEKQKEIIELKELLSLKNILSDFNITYTSTINRNVSYWQEILTIDKGSNDGIKKDMAVITSLGLIGKIERVGKTSSEVVLLTATSNNYQVSVAVQSQIVHHGVLNNYRRENQMFLVTGISASAVIEDGTYITTSGLGGVFPSGIGIGRVHKSYNDPYGISKIIEVKPEQDFNNLKYMAVAIKEVK